MEIYVNFILAILIGYALGSIPFGLLLTKIAGGPDIRSIGSGNIGATNVLRTGNKLLAATTLILDILKGTVAVLIVAHFIPGTEPLAAAAAFFGHLFPIWLKFEGGKGVATYAGILFGLFWNDGMVGGYIFAICWIGTLVISRYSSLAGIIAAISAPITAAIVGKSELVPLLIACTLILIWKHWPNILRLLSGNEPKVGKSK
ncbi:glycerol-3-phosphate acyltransferase [Sphingorhabdus lutea]|uniref:Glycerol-3-phosphate acyltransferase n=1 Tax=Sphingorhabdus lutea TaxID=1913578 RepID=A0A1L3JC50_9SPHN|nr:glycerol-3-phosphate 1-O-acyltransferase PlsY [Sphingorhabdus lutea]APG62643.1 glycerol-3-phosphate acyltransferase [Sphingorhabdus lutea]